MFEVKPRVCASSVRHEAVFSGREPGKDIGRSQVSALFKACVGMAGCHPGTVSLVSLRKMVGTCVRDAYGDNASKLALHHQAVETTFTHYNDR